MNEKTLDKLQSIMFDQIWKVEGDLQAFLNNEKMEKHEREAIERALQHIEAAQKPLEIFS